MDAEIEGIIAQLDAIELKCDQIVLQGMGDLIKLGSRSERRCGGSLEISSKSKRLLPRLLILLRLLFQAERHPGRRGDLPHMPGASSQTASLCGVRYRADR